MTNPERHLLRAYALEEVTNPGTALRGELAGKTFQALQGVLTILEREWEAGIRFVDAREITRSIREGLS